MDIYQELKRDHREIKAMLNELVGLKKDNDYRFILIVEIRNALISHSRAEEAVLYNSLRAENEDGARTGRQGYKEHFEMETLLRSLQFMDRLDGNWKPLARKLRDLVNHHLKKEETHMFALARKLFDPIQAEQMGALFRKLKPQIQQEGDMLTTIDMVVNMLPPKYSSRILSSAKSL